MSNDPNLTNGLVDRLRAGDDKAFDRLVGHTYQRLQLHTHRMLRTFGGVRRWDQTGDVLNTALYRLQKALPKVKLKSDRHFYHLAAMYIRRVLLDLARRYRGPHGWAANHHTDSSGGALARAADPATGPDNFLQWADFQRKAKQLPPDMREVFDLVWVHGMSRKEIAEILGVSVDTVKKRWLKVRLALDKLCNGDAPNN
jgi:RNA polymerase sigma-70 factor (ECF subfamily)